MRLGEDARLIFPVWEKIQLTGAPFKRMNCIALQSSSFWRMAAMDMASFAKEEMLCLRVCRSDKWSFMHCEIRRLFWHPMILPL